MSAAPLDPLTVVVVDDEPDVATYLAAVLEKRGHLTRTAGGSADGLALIRDLHPHVACIDIVMPEETGVRLFQRIRADSSLDDVAVVFITALKPEMAAVRDGLDIEPIPNADAYVEKPPNPETFVEAVERAARSRRRRQ